MATLVKFLIEKDSVDDVFAYFPQLKADNEGNKTCYAHIGQHSACSPEYAAECQPANEFQFADLKSELEQIGYDLKPIGVPQLLWYSGNYTELQLPTDVVRMCSHSGDCDEDVTRCLELPEVAAAMAKLNPESVIKELAEYGAWSDEELSNHADNLKRLLWIAAGNIQEGL